ncbi:tryptophan synthase subunit alpha [Candidatus Vidania fulgoroideorum]
MKLLPFLVPYFPKKKIFFKSLKFLKKSNIKNIEIGVPSIDSYLDTKCIRESYKKVYKKVKLLELLTKISVIFNNYFNIILVSYYKDIIEIGEKKIYKYIKNKYIYKLIIIDLPYNIKGYIYKKIIKSLIFFVPFNKIKLYNNLKESFYYHLSLKDKPIRKNYNKNKFKIVGFNINKKKIFNKYKNYFNKVAIGTLFIKCLKKNFFSFINKINLFLKC